MSSPPVLAETVPPRGRRVRVCLVGPSLDILGGQAVQLERLRQRLQEIPTLDVGFLAVNPRLPGPLRLLQRVKYVRTLSTSAAYGWSLVRHVASYDVVHAFSASYWSYLLAPFPALFVARRFGVPTVLNYRSGEAADHLTRWPRSVATMRLADSIVVPSGYLVDVFRRHGFAARAIPNFVEVERIPYRRRTAPRPVFLSNRNLEPMYSVDLVIRAFAKVQARYPEARLIVVGDGTQRTTLRQLVDALAIRNVDFRGLLPHKEMIALYDEADIYLNAPSIDNMPNSVIEAFAAGIPVVTTDTGGIPYIAEHERNALLVKTGDVDGLFAGAMRVLTEPALAARLSDQARSECLTKYVWGAVRDQWENLYLELAARRTSRTAHVGADR